MRRVKYLPRRHWTPRYVLDRVLAGQYRRRHPDRPWLTQDAIGILDGWLRPEYVGGARESSAASLDFALVDGEYRDQCAEAMLTAVKPGGLLVVDNANWFLASPGTRSPYQLRQRTTLWERVEASLASWRRIWTTNGVTDTAFYVRPATVDGRSRDKCG